MEITEELIKKFFDKQCSPEEAQFVAEFLQDHPLVAEKFLNHEWSQAENNALADPQLKSSMWNEISIHTIKPLRTSSWNVYRNIISIAASLILIITVWILYSENTSNKHEVAPEKNTLATRQNDKRKVLRNAGAAPVQYLLPDGSQVVLSPDAELSFSENFSNNSRDLLLKGEGLFKVEKDSLRPFTVNAGNFSTTALGTIFKVSESANRYEVKLLEGKVVVKALNNSLPGWSNDIFLQPGEVMHYNTARAEVMVSVDTKRKTKSPKLSQPDIENVEALKFDNIVLSEAFRKLSKHFSQKIRFNDTELKGMFFSGTVLKQDSLEMILNVIAQMNSLTVTKTENGFEVKKIQ